MKYTFSVDVFSVNEAEHKIVATVTGEVEAERTSSAYIRAWPIIIKECRRIESEQNCKTGCGELIVMQKEDL